MRGNLRRRLLKPLTSYKDRRVCHGECFRCDARFLCFTTSFNEELEVDNMLMSSATVRTRQDGNNTYVWFKDDEYGISSRRH